jgi:hypothetical protein
MKTKELQIDTLKSVGVTQIIPEQWEDFIWTGLSDDAPFSWGDNNHSLVDAMSFKDHLESVLDFYEEDYEEIKQYRQAVIDTLSYLEAQNIYIDLEE